MYWCLQLEVLFCFGLVHPGCMVFGSVILFGASSCCQIARFHVVCGPLPLQKSGIASWQVVWGQH